MKKSHCMEAMETRCLLSATLHGYQAIILEGQDLADLCTPLGLDPSQAACQSFSVIGFKPQFDHGVLSSAAPVFTKSQLGNLTQSALQVQCQQIHSAAIEQMTEWFAEQNSTLTPSAIALAASDALCSDVQGLSKEAASSIVEAMARSVFSAEHLLTRGKWQEGLLDKCQKSLIPYGENGDGVLSQLASCQEETQTSQARLKSLQTRLSACLNLQKSAALTGTDLTDQLIKCKRLVSEDQISIAGLKKALGSTATAQSGNCTLTCKGVHKAILGTIVCT